MPLTMASVSMHSGVPAPLYPYSTLFRSVPVGLKPPVTVALSAMLLPTTAVGGCWLVLIAGLAGVRITGSRAVPLVTALVLLWPLLVATQVSVPVAVAG